MRLRTLMCVFHLFFHGGWIFICEWNTGPLVFLPHIHPVSKKLIVSDWAPFWVLLRRRDITIVTVTVVTIVLGISEKLERRNGSPSMLLPFTCCYVPHIFESEDRSRLLFTDDFFYHDLFVRKFKHVFQLYNK